MPKDTFFNLSEDKKKKIYGAAVKEFSAKRLSEASINNIVKEAGIPRGSFYQYFSGKEDIYAYMAGVIAKEQAVVERFLAQTAAGAGAFDGLLHKARAALELYRVRPEYRRVALLAQGGAQLFGQSSFADEIESISELLERDKLRGIIREDSDASLAAEMAYSLITKECLKEGQDKDEALRRISGIIATIMQGIAARGLS